MSKEAATLGEPKGLSFDSVARGNYTAIHIPALVPALWVGVMFRGYMTDPAAEMGCAGIVLTPVIR